MLATISSHLRWTVDYERCSVVLPTEGSLQHWAMSLGDSLEARRPNELTDGHAQALVKSIAASAPSLTERSGEGPYGVALPLQTPDGALGAVCVSRSQPFSQEDVRHLQHACVALGSALARIVTAQNELRTQQELRTAEERNRMLAEDRALFAEQMVGIVSHDLRNPLSAIFLGMNLLTRGEELPPQKARVVDSVAGAARRARRMVDDLLDFTRSRLGHGLSVERKYIDLHEVVAHAIDELRLSFEGHELLHSAEGPGEADADAERIEQVLGNLVANAVAYGNEYSPIRIISSVHSGEVSIAVHNLGPSIPEPLQGSLFEPMVRGATKTTARNVGLGLYIVRAIARAHDGDVGVESRDDIGTTLTVHFPAS